MSAPPLDDAIGQLSAVPPRSFVKERSALVERLTKLGQAAVAAKVKALRAPTIPVWAVNQLARENPRLVDALVSAAERVGAAQLGRGAAMPLGAAMTAYREATDAVMARLDDLLAAADVRAPHQVRLRIQNTLMAAAADPKARKALRAGRIEHELAASGFDLFSGAMPARATAPERAAPAQPAAASAREKASARPGRERRSPPEPSAHEPVVSARERQAAEREARERLRREARQAAEREKAERLRPLQEAAAEAAKALAEAKENARGAAAAVVAATRHRREADRALRAARRGRR